MPRIPTRNRRPLDGGPMPYDDEHQPVKRKRATPECAPPGIAGRVCDGLSWRRSNPSASNPPRQFGAFPHASKNSWCGARRTLACASDPKLHFTLNHYRLGSNDPSRRPLVPTRSTDHTSCSLREGFVACRRRYGADRDGNDVTQFEFTASPPYIHHGPPLRDRFPREKRSVPNEPIQPHFRPQERGFAISRIASSGFVCPLPRGFAGSGKRSRSMRIFCAVETRCSVDRCLDFRRRRASDKSDADASGLARNPRTACACIVPYGCGCRLFAPARVAVGR